LCRLLSSPAYSVRPAQLPVRMLKINSQEEKRRLAAMPLPQLPDVQEASDWAGGSESLWKPRFLGLC